MVFIQPKFYRSFLNAYFFTNGKSNKSTGIPASITKQQSIPTGKINVSTIIKISDSASMSSNASASDSSSVNQASSVNPTVAAAVVNRKIIIDETLLPPDEAEKVLARRAYNRDCATRARKRVKQTVSQLEKQVKELQDDKDALRRSLVTMEKQVNELENQNRALNLQNQVIASTGRAGMVEGLSGDTYIGTSFSPSMLLQSRQQEQLCQQLRQQFPSASSMVGSAANGGIIAGGMDLVQLSRYMKSGSKGYF